MAQEGTGTTTRAEVKSKPKRTARLPAAADASAADRITSSLVRHMGAIARECGASAVLVYVDALAEASMELPDGLSQRVYYVTKTPEQSKEQRGKDHQIIQVPNVPLTRMGQVKIAVLLGLSRGLLKRDDVIVCLSGLADSGSLDTLVVLQVEREFEMFLAPLQDEEVAPHILPEVLERVIDLATELGSEGREGKPVGALFVIGDTERVLSLSRQLILNPFRGYPEEERNILDPALEETVKELATIDGAFIIRGDGVIETAGAYLKISSQEGEFKLPQGLGARHHAAAAITGVSEAVAVTVSESTGTVTIFRNGRIITEIEKPRSAALGRHL